MNKKLVEWIDQEYNLIEPNFIQIPPTNPILMPDPPDNPRGSSVLQPLQREFAGYQIY